MERFCILLTRRKCLEHTASTQSKLHKCLSPTDLMLLGIAGTIGSGVYVLVGQVARLTAGPAVIVSFVIAALTSVFAALCYAEFGARVPLAGSAYVYSYVSVGELWAFVIGWNLILEYVISCAAIAKATSGYIDTLSDYVMSEYLTAHVPLKLATLSPYPDFLALGIVIVFTVILCLGLRESSLLNSILTIVNLVVILYAIVCGLFWVDLHNWNIDPNEVPNPEVDGQGGFFPYGVQGAIAGAATCFYAFVGFDVIATAGEETINPSKSIPFAITGCIIVSSLSYFATSVVLTLMSPYYELNPTASLPTAFNDVGWPVAAKIVSIGAICAFTSALLGNSFAMPRVIYSMANDGLLFKCLAIVNQRFMTPVYATIVSGVLTGLMTTLMNLEELIEMFSIGTLLAYTLVSVCVIMLRYEPDWKLKNGDPALQNFQFNSNNTCKQLLKCLFNLCLYPSNTPSVESYAIIRSCVAVIAMMSIVIDLVVIHASSYLLRAVPWSIIIVVIPSIILLLSVFIVWRQPRNSTVLPFQVPWLPFIPVISIFLNIYLMISLTMITWIRFFIWMFAGFLIYFLYGIHHDAQHIRQEATYLKIEGVNSSEKPPTLSQDDSISQPSVDTAEIDVKNAEKDFKTAEKDTKTVEKGVKTAEKDVKTAEKDVKTTVKGFKTTAKDAKTAETDIKTGKADVKSNTKTE